MIASLPARPFASVFALALCALLPLAAARAEAPPEYTWEKLEIDTIEIGYGLQLTDVDGDGRTDIVLADKSTVQWYHNDHPAWTKHVIARDLTVRDNVCVAARDLDGDGKCELAVGGQWNFRESIKDGAVHYLIPPASGDRTQPWTPVKLKHEPSTHRMHWIRGPGGEHDYRLVVKPLRGKGSIDGEGPGLKILDYRRPGDPQAMANHSAWTTSEISDFLHLSHNFHPVNWDDDPEEELIVAAKEGVWHFDRPAGDDGSEPWHARQLSEDFAGEIRDGRLPGGRRFIVTVEPMHGTASSVYVQPEGDGDGETNGGALWPRSAVLDDALVDGHALAVADFLGVGYDQVVVGWRAMNHDGPKGPDVTPPAPGIRLFTPLDAAGSQWRTTDVSGREVTVEDIKAADLDGDGRPDIVAAARQTKNLVIFLSGRSPN